MLIGQSMSVWKNEDKNEVLSRMGILFENSRYTVSENEYGPFATLWSKSAIFRGVWQNVDIQLHPWAPTALLPHIRAFKRGI